MTPPAAREARPPLAHCFQPISAFASSHSPRLWRDTLRSLPPRERSERFKSGDAQIHGQNRSSNIAQKHVLLLQIEMQLPPLFSMVCISTYANTLHGCAFGAALAGRKSDPCNVASDRFHSPRRKRKRTLSEWTAFAIILLLNRLACQAVVFEAGRNPAKQSPPTRCSGVTASAFRASKRRLEVRGFEPLAFSLRTRRSTN
jgi:hypothetical protein